MNKRDFLRSALIGATGFATTPDLPAARAATAVDSATDEEFWAGIRRQFRLSPDFINLENGFYCFQPEPVLAAYLGHVRAVNLEASHYMRTRKDNDKVRVRTRLASFGGCAAEELALTRNTTESLDTVINGIDWRPGDEAVMAHQDYGAMLDTFAVQARRHGMVNRLVDIPLQPASDEEIVAVYAAALTARSRLLMIPHMVNITGQILPVRAICDMAHSRGVPVMVDGAHTFAQIDFRIDDLHCDYFGASLHKWLSAPLGAGILYVRRDRIASLWPVFGDDSVPNDDIRKLNHTGTHPAHTDLAIEAAIDFHERIGTARKEARLRYLQRYWTSQVRGHPGIIVNTPDSAPRACAIANVGISGMPPADLARRLLDDYRIYTVAIDGAGVHGVRVTPQVYTTTAELDAFVHAVTRIAA